jgi:hypothetical protein
MRMTTTFKKMCLMILFFIFAFWHTSQASASYTRQNYLEALAFFGFQESEILDGEKIETHFKVFKEIFGEDGVAPSPAKMAVVEKTRNIIEAGEPAQTYESVRPLPKLARQGDLENENLLNKRAQYIYDPDFFALQESMKTNVVSETEFKKAFSEHFGTGVDINLFTMIQKISKLNTWRISLQAVKESVKILSPILEKLKSAKLDQDLVILVAYYLGPRFHNAQAMLIDELAQKISNSNELFTLLRLLSKAPGNSFSIALKTSPLRDTLVEKIQKPLPSLLNIIYFENLTGIARVEVLKGIPDRSFTDQTFNSLLNPFPRPNPFPYRNRTGQESEIDSAYFPESERENLVTQLASSDKEFFNLIREQTFKLSPFTKSQLEDFAASKNPKFQKIIELTCGKSLFKK